MRLIPEAAAPRAALAVALATLPAGATYAALEQIPATSSNHGAQVEACAKQLGGRALVREAEMPAACDTFSTDFVLHGRIVRVRAPAPGQPDTDLVSEVELTTPSVFRARERDTVETEEDHLETGVRYLTGTIGLAGALAFFGAMTAGVRERRRKSQSAEPAIV